MKTNQSDVTTDRIEKVSERTAFERFGKLVQGILIAGVGSLFVWAWTISTDVAILKANAITPSHLKELKIEILQAFDKSDVRTSAQLTDHELRIRIQEAKK